MANTVDNITVEDEKEVLKVDLATIIRTILLLVGIANSILQMFGKNIIPFTNDDIAQAITMVYDIIVAIIVWWKNNSFTKAALIGDKAMKIARLKK